MLSTGPQVISIPISDQLLDYAGYLARFLDQGGVIVWGVVPTEGPALTTAARQSRVVDALWADLAERGVDADRLHQQSLLSTVCGLAGHHVSVARRLTRLTGEIGRTVLGEHDRA